MRLVEKVGRSLTQKELKKERKREEKYRKRLADKSKPDDEEDVAFDEDLVSRYNVHRQGMVDIRGRPAYIISFEPKSGPFPTKKRRDRALNKSAGRLWIDTETYEIAQLEFELLDEVKIGWGLFGSIKQLRGRLQQEPVDGYPEVWLPSRFDIYMNGRIFFKTLHRNEKMEWSDFRKLHGLLGRTRRFSQTVVGHPARGDSASALATRSSRSVRPGAAGTSTQRCTPFSARGSPQTSFLEDILNLVEIGE